jgi:hypothetical protein
MGFPDTCTGISVDQRNEISRYMYWHWHCSKKWDFQIHVLALVLFKEMGFPDTCTGIGVVTKNGIFRYMYWH